MTTLNSTDVVVVGAGPTGLALACELAMRGVAVQLLEVPDEILIERIVARGQQAAAHGEAARSDDTEEVARRRQEVYREQTRPLIEYYGARSHLRHVDGVGTMDEVYGRIMQAMR